MNSSRELYDKRFEEVYNQRGSYTFGSAEEGIGYFCRYGIDRTSKILDVGSNVGEFIYGLSNKGWHNVYGVEICETAVRVGKDLYPAIGNRMAVYDGEVMPFDDEEYDVVTMFNVLEHIPNLETFLRGQIYRILKPGGMLIFQTPNKIIDVFYESIKFKSLTRWKKYHCSLQTPASMKSLLERCGFRGTVIERMKMVDSEYYRNAVNKRFGSLITDICIFILDRAPKVISPVIYGSARKG